jgi:nicotinate-nucleotide pyrophosphorylase (carboxylating)
MTASPWLRRAVATALEEDLGRGDLTGELCVPADVQARGEITAKVAGVIAGMDAVLEVAAQVDEALQVEVLKRDGDMVEPGDAIARVLGPGRSMLAFERTALNFLQQLSGVATLARAFVQQVTGTKAVVVDTRKTVPGLRALQKAAVVAGGGRNHRFGLYDAILIKDNHIRLAGGIENALARARAGAPFMAKIEIEVMTPDDAELAADLGADVIMLDNMSAEAVRESVARVNGRALTEVSGGVRLDTIREFAELGVDIISAGALTHSAPALDVSLEIEEWTS